jgi:CubicO group peptidase (beta-lactamase class C family)
MKLNLVGAHFLYGLNTDVLGHIVELVTGQSFRLFLQQELFAKLDMTDTDFVVTDATNPSPVQPTLNFTACTSCVCM